jgi:hypothetical protein
LKGVRRLKRVKRSKKKRKLGEVEGNQGRYRRPGFMENPWRSEGDASFGLSPLRLFHSPLLSLELSVFLSIY